MTKPAVPDRTTPPVPGPRRPDIGEVALRAGVAKSSVSRVFNGHPNVSPDLVSRVRKAAQELGYEPNMLAGSLRRGSTMTAGFLVGDISNPLMSRIALGADSVLTPAHYSLLLTNSGGDPAQDAAHLRLLRLRRVDGLLASLASEDDEATRSELAKIEVPIVLVDREPTIAKGASTVLSDHSAGIEAAAAYLLELGHRHVALVNGSTKVRPARERARALRKAFRNVADAVVTVRSGSFMQEYGERITTELLAGTSPPTAIIAGSNQLLIGVLRAIHAAGLAVPADVSIIACDDVALADFLPYPLATIRREPEAMGAAAAQLLLRRLSGGPAASTILPTEFVKAASCASPRGLPSARSRRERGTPTR
jgi:LacI family transcriptional regulator